MSVIEEAPHDRHPVQTYVLEHDDGVIHEAIRREIRRGGQVYYLHNDVATIERLAAKIQAAVPEARVGFGHGKMNEQEPVSYTHLLDEPTSSLDPRSQYEMMELVRSLAREKMCIRDSH